jgi:Flp pilus assembly protein TadD
MYGAMATAAMIDENYPEAVTWAQKALVQNRRFAAALRVLAVALIKVGQRDGATQVVQEMLAIEPQMTISGFLSRVPVLSTAKTYA